MVRTARLHARNRCFRLAGDQFKKVSDFERRVKGGLNIVELDHLTVNVSIVRSLSERDDMKFG